MCERSEERRESKSALVSISTPSGLRTRVVRYSGDVSVLRSAILESFKDILQCSQSSVILQVRDDSWGEDVFVDVVGLDQEIPDRAVMRIMETIQSEEGAANNLSTAQSVAFNHPQDSGAVAAAPGKTSTQLQLSLSKSGVSLCRGTTQESSIPNVEMASPGLSDEDINRQKLLDAARSKVNSSYSFKKGKSRSNKYCGAVESTATKQPRLTFDARVERMKRLEEDIQNLKERISYKEKRRQMAENVKNYKACDDITEEIASLSKQKRELENELLVLQKKTKRSMSYHSRNVASSQESDDSSSKTRRLHKSLKPKESKVVLEVSSVYSDDSSSADTIILSDNESSQTSSRGQSSSNSQMSSGDQTSFVDESPSVDQTSSTELMSSTDQISSAGQMSFVGQITNQQKDTLF
ncbi:uncharacterized protein [Dysidea avara]|uniref:uncharacterized protein n=1 Tax=Dysidea avara TaxID=196820 RepID=UPI003329BB10